MLPRNDVDFGAATSRTDLLPTDWAREGTGRDGVTSGLTHAHRGPSPEGDGRARWSGGRSS